MKKIFEFIQEELENAFEAAGYDRGLGTTRELSHESFSSFEPKR